MTKFSFSWTCRDCKTRNEMPLSKFQAAFLEALKVKRSVECKKCGGRNVRGCAWAPPDLDDPELLQAWLSDKKLYFSSQDEELMLVDVRSSVLVELIESEATPPVRRGTLFLALVYKTVGKYFHNPDDARIAKEYLRETHADWGNSKAIPFQTRKRVRAILDEV